MDSLKFIVFPANQTEWVSVISLSVGIVSVLLAILFYFKSKRAKVLLFAQRSFRVVTDRVSNIPELKVTIRGRPVNNITMTRLAIWNGGNQTIYAHDIPKLAPLVVFPLGQSHTYSITVLETTGVANQIKLEDWSPQDKEWPFTFEFLNPGDGAVMTIVHGGNDRDLFEVVGKLKGGHVRRGLRTREEDRNYVPIGPGGFTYEIPLTSGGLRIIGYGAIIVGLIYLGLTVFAVRPEIGFLIPLLFLLGGVCALFIAHHYYPHFKLTKFDDF